MKYDFSLKIGGPYCIYEHQHSRVDAGPFPTLSPSLLSSECAVSAPCLWELRCAGSPEAHSRAASSGRGADVTVQRSSRLHLQAVWPQALPCLDAHCSGGPGRPLPSTSLMPGAQGNPEKARASSRSAEPALTLCIWPGGWLGIPQSGFSLCPGKLLALASHLILSLGNCLLSLKRKEGTRRGLCGWIEAGLCWLNLPLPSRTLFLVDPEWEDVLKAQPQGF